MGQQLMVCIVLTAEDQGLALDTHMVAPSLL